MSSFFSRQEDFSAISISKNPKFPLGALGVLAFLARIFWLRPKAALRSC
jgi:hypothetical protein